MRIALIASDEKLYELCREVLSGMSVTDILLTLERPNASCGPADLRIWDFHPGMALPTNLTFQQELQNLFLVERDHLAAFQDVAPAPTAAVLLKPVNHGTLSAFVSQVVARYKSAHINHEDSRRADRDELLQCFFQANLRLQEYDQDRTNFLARALHDFRAPLTALHGYCGLLLEQRLGPLTADQADLLRRMHQSVKRLSRMSTAVFELSVRRSIERRPELRRANIEACIQQAVHEITPHIDERGVTLGVQVEPAPRDFLFDPTKIEQVLVNLLENACKFTPRHGSIQLQGYPAYWRAGQARGCAPDDAAGAKRRQPNVYRIDVRDSGPGIPPEHLNSIFQEYTSYSGGRDRSGAGLGLAICKMIVTAHQGAVWAESMSNGGSFSFVLPMTQDPATQEPRSSLPAAAAS